ncbi:calcineurin-like phosphoesterase superfamily [Gottschalkia purinilytica]|uniref:Calcineurin-like phosphoesterase superfamily n=1 Tax=Gottschalkia purinilytica TaxID=1503 RepID=A0A0L0W9P6_GOTPU|nr:metallophosphoesterase family protein [Gottschalkia purinilytica]KNF08167.1 calcineurin-like phosphoesterase superfamily [Gottschalkia purinilytica]
MGRFRVAVVSDINANIYALNSFLSFIDSGDIKIDYIFNLGNFTQRGPHPCEVFDVVMNDDRFINILGPSEYSILGKNNDSKSINDSNLHQDWIVDKLGDKRINKLKNLSTSKVLEILGQKILLVHTDNLKGLDWESRLLVSIMDKYRTEQLENNEVFSFDYIFCGNTNTQDLDVFTHPLSFPSRTLTVVNPGDLGCLINNLSSFTIIDFEDNKADISFKRVTFDLDNLIKDMYDNNVPNKEDILYSSYKIKNVDRILRSKDFLRDHVKNQGNMSIELLDLHNHDTEFFEKIVSLVSEKSKYFEFSCWEDNISLIDEIKNYIDCDIRKKEYYNDRFQLYCKGKISKDIINLIKSNSLDNNGNLKWCSISLSDSLDKSSTKFHLSNHDLKYQLFNLDEKDVECIISLINDENLHYKIY